MSATQSNIGPEEMNDGNRTVNAAIAIVVAALAVLALFGTSVLILAPLALMGLGSILILADWRVTNEPFVMLV